MKQLSPKVHGILDYATVAFLLCAPFLFDMQPNGRLFTFVLGFVHLVLTLTTDFPMGVFRIIPLRIHGLIELIVSVLLLVMANLFRVTNDITAFYFYLVFAIVLFLVWIGSEYSNAVQVKKVKNP